MAALHNNVSASTSDSCSNYYRAKTQLFNPSNQQKGKLSKIAACSVASVCFSPSFSLFTHHLSPNHSNLIISLTLLFASTIKALAFLTLHKTRRLPSSIPLPLRCNAIHHPPSSVSILKPTPHRRHTFINNNHQNISHGSKSKGCGQSHC